MLDPRCIYRKSIFAKCTRLACLLSFASLLKLDMYPNNFRPSVKHVLGVLEWFYMLTEKILFQNRGSQSINQRLFLSATHRIFQERKALYDQSHWCTYKYSNNHRVEDQCAQEWPPAHRDTTQGAAQSKTWRRRHSRATNPSQGKPKPATKPKPPHTKHPLQSSRTIG